MLRTGEGIHTNMAYGGGWERLVKASESSREGVITPRRTTLQLARIVLAQETVCSDKSGGRWEFVGNYHDAESHVTRR